MRRTVVVIAALLLASAATPLLAGGGPPKLANIETGPYLAVHMAHDFFRLFAGGRAVAFNATALFDVYVTGSLALFSTSTLQALQFGVLGLGLAGSILTAYKIGQRGAFRALLPQLVVLVIFGLVNVYLFTLPMAHRV